MDTAIAQQNQDQSLKLKHGRWFHLKREGLPLAPPEVATRRDDGREGDRPLAEGSSPFLNGLPAKARENLNQFLAVVAGQVQSSVAVARSPRYEELRQQNIAIMYRYIELENTRDYEKMEMLFHPTEFRSKTYFGNDPISPKAHTRMLKGLFRSFPDWFMVINEIICADDCSCVALITGRGTQYEEFAGRPPADHQIAIPTLHAIKVHEGLIIEHRHINPFEDIFANQIMAPLTEDIMAVRAQQGFDSGMAQRAYEAALAAGARESELAELKALIETKRRQCQVLLKGTLRRCAMIAPPGEIYCEHHQKHGYGIDGIE
jgi:hypothetical protein